MGAGGDGKAPWETGGGDAGGGGGGGAITPPSFAGAGGYLTDIPPGYEQIPGFPGYFYNPTTDDIRIATGYGNASARDDVGNPIVGAPSVSTRSLTKAEDAEFRRRYAAFVQAQGGDASGGAAAGGSGGPSPETVRANRMAEVQNAIDALDQRVRAAQQARLTAAQYAVTPDMRESGYFPALGPASPLVRAGLAEPLRFQPIAFNPERGLELDARQTARDLAAIRGLAGY